MVTSTIPAFRAALLAMLAARAAQPGNALAGVSLCDGPPPPAVLASEMYVALIETRGTQRIYAMNRATQPREERFTQVVEISVRGATRSDQVTLGDTAFTLLGEIEQGIRADTTLAAYYAGGGKLIQIVVGSEHYQTFADDSERESRITVGVDVHARL